MKICPSIRRFACFPAVFLALRRLDPRNEALLEAVVKQAKTTRHQWLVAGDANMCPEDFEKSPWLQRDAVAPKEASTCRSKGPKGEWIERTYDYVFACKTLRVEFSQMKVVEDL